MPNPQVWFFTIRLTVFHCQTAIFAKTRNDLALILGILQSALHFVFNLVLNAGDWCSVESFFFRLFYGKV